MSLTTGDRLESFGFFFGFFWTKSHCDFNSPLVFHPQQVQTSLRKLLEKAELFSFSFKNDLK